MRARAFLPCELIALYLRLIDSAEREPSAGKDAKFLSPYSDSGERKRREGVMIAAAGAFVRPKRFLQDATGSGARRHGGRKSPSNEQKEVSPQENGSSRKAAIRKSRGRQRTEERSQNEVAIDACTVPETLAEGTRCQTDEQGERVEHLLA